jgi:hypothetical protein
MGLESPAPSDRELIERAVLNDTETGREITAAFVRSFGDFMSTSVRPALVALAIDGGQPQLLVNGLAELLRSTAEAIEFPLDHPRAGSPGSQWWPAEPDGTNPN